MPRRLRQQRRGKGKPRYIARTFRSPGAVGYPPILDAVISGEIVDIFHSPFHTAPLMEVRWETGEKSFLVAPLGIKVGDIIKIGPGAEASVGNILPLSDIPVGSEIMMIELRPGDGGKIVRTAGSSARLISKDEKYAYIALPSKEIKMFNLKCRAMIGKVAGGGRKEKPLLKAGRVYYIRRKKGKRWPIVAACAMNAVDHPFGGKGRRLSKPKTVSRNAPPGKKVGSIAARRTGRRKK